MYNWSKILKAYYIPTGDNHFNLQGPKYVENWNI